MSHQSTQHKQSEMRLEPKPLRCQNPKNDGMGIFFSAIQNNKSKKSLAQYNTWNQRHKGTKEDIPNTCLLISILNSILYSTETVHFKLYLYTLPPSKRQTAIFVIKMASPSSNLLSERVVLKLLCCLENSFDLVSHFRQKRACISPRLKRPCKSSFYRKLVGSGYVTSIVRSH